MGLRNRRGLEDDLLVLADSSQRPDSGGDDRVDTIRDRRRGYADVVVVEFEREREPLSTSEGSVSRVL